MEIVLFRHGIAEAFSNNGDDAERRLTKKGIKGVEKSAKGLRMMLRNRKRILVYSSHLRRALQTADIIAEKLSMKGISVREDIACGNFVEITKEMREKNAKTTVIIVGHEPYFSSWCKKMTGADLEIKKSSAVGIEVNDEGEFVGELSFYLTSTILQSLVK